MATAIHFLLNCQNLPLHNVQLWVSGEARRLVGERHARWWENEIALTTSYALMSLELIWRGL